MATLLGCTALASLALASPASAQSAAAPAAPVASAPDTGDIVVTAQKRSENVQKVPKLIEVLSGKEIASAGVTKLVDLQNISPTLTGSDQTQNSRPPGVRGIVSVANSVGVQAQTGIVVDDVPLPTYSTLANDLADVERVEVFAGPQSTLSGRNSAAGLINIVTRAPKFTRSADVSVEQTSDRQTRVTANLNLPISDTVAFNVSGVLNHWSGPYTNSLIPGHFGGYKTEGARAKLLWQATNALKLTLTGYYISTDGTQPPLLAGGPMIYASSGASYVTLDANKTPLSSYGYGISGNNRTYTSNQTATFSNKDVGGSLRIDLDVGKLGSLTSLTSYSYSAQPRADVFFGYPSAPANYYAYTDVQTKYTTQEVRLVSPSSGRLNYTLGVFYTNADLYEPYIRRQVFPVNWLRWSHQQSIALFGRATYQLTSADFITAGLRYQHDRQGYAWDFRNVATDAVTAHSQGGSPYDFGSGEISLRHEFNRDVSVYATYSRTETGQAYDVENNAAAAVGTLKPLASEKVSNYEIGVKGRFLDRRLMLNLTGFWADYSNYQVQSIDSSDPTQAPVIRLLAIGAVRTRGVEAQATLKVTSALSAGLAGAYTESVIRDYPGAGCYLNQTLAQGCVNGAQANLAGLSLPNAPRWKLNGNLNYRRPLSGKVDLTSSLQWRYQSQVHYDMLGNPLTTQGGYSVFNLRLGLAAPDSAERKWTLEAFANNLFDKTFYTTVNDNSNRFTYPTGSGTVLSVRYARDSFRYFGVRGTVAF
ncbi:TonB-dependent receptor [Novosphingobium rosa]|uniref:TonB-dependent receptor n=1 Tax=Novosphingobium rosa TaxID=76978 RepID=UPI000835367D|nr:TonB-dependent receptor [Novosphingobium rosa]